MIYSTLTPDRSAAAHPARAARRARKAFRHRGVPHFATDPAPRGHPKPSRFEPLESRLLFAGAPDPTFGVAGRSRVDVADLSDAATALHVLADGKILVAGNAAYGLDADAQPLERAFVARLNADGSLDNTFGAAGIATYDAAAAPRVSRASALAVAADGRIFLGGTAASPDPESDRDAAFAVAAFTPAGAADTTFGTRGVALADMTPQLAADEGEWVTQLLVDSDGRVLAVGGIGSIARGGAMVGLVRFDAAGQRDASFARRIETLGQAPQGLPGTAAALAPDGKIVLADRRGSTGGSFIVFRYNPDGSPDTTFSDDGYNLAPVARGVIETWAAPGPVGISDVLIRPDGKVVAAGRASATEVAVFRFNADGTRDDSFGDAGSVIASTGPLSDIDLEPAADDGFTLAAVSTYGPLKRNPDFVAPAAGTPTGFHAYVGRFDAAGDLTGSTQMNGSARPRPEQLNVVTLLPDGKLLAAGVSHPTEHAGEGAAWDQTADALVVRIDPALQQETANRVTAPIVAPPAPTPPATPPVITPGNGDSDNWGVVRPAATGFAGKPTVTRGRFYTFKLTYADANSARNTQIDIAGPAGSVGGAVLLKVRAPRARGPGKPAAGPAVATYRAPAPGGKFDAGDNGQYSVRIVTGFAGSVPIGPVVGQFNVAARGKGGARPLRRLTVPPVQTAAEARPNSAAAREAAPARFPTAPVVTFPIGADPYPLPPGPRSFRGKPLARKGTHYTFTLDYINEVAAHYSPVGLYGPAGLVAPAEMLDVRMVKIRPGDRSRSLEAVATYRVSAPGGWFDAGDNGAYAVRLGTRTAEPLGTVVGEFTVASKVRTTEPPPVKGIRTLTGVLQRPADARPGISSFRWLLTRPGKRPVELDVAALPYSSRLIPGNAVTVTGRFAKIAVGGRGKTSGFVVATIAAAP